MRLEARDASVSFTRDLPRPPSVSAEGEDAILGLQPATHAISMGDLGVPAGAIPSGMAWANAPRAYYLLGNQQGTTLVPNAHLSPRDFHQTSQRVFSTNRATGAPDPQLGHMGPNS